jgi:hypothetical protein
MKECKAIRSIVPLLSIRRNYNAQLGNVGFVEDSKATKARWAKFGAEKSKKAKT